MRAFMSLVVISLALLLSVPAHAKEGVVARLRDPLPQDSPVGSVITVAWMLVISGERDQPFNACGVFVQLRSKSGGASTRAYADADCRAHATGEYEARVVVPDGGIGAIEIGLSGTTDVFFPVVEASRVTGLPTTASSESRSVTWPLLVAAAVLSALALSTGHAVRGWRSRIGSRVVTP